MYDRKYTSNQVWDHLVLFELIRMDFCGHDVRSKKLRFILTKMVYACSHTCKHLCASDKYPDKVLKRGKGKDGTGRGGGTVLRK